MDLVMKKKHRNLLDSHSVVLGLVALVDILVIFLAGHILYLVHPAIDSDKYERYLFLILMAASFVIVSFYLSGLYRQDIKTFVSHPSNKTGITLTISFLCVIAVIFLLKVSDMYSRLWLFNWYVLSLVLVALMRTLIARYLQTVRKDFLIRNVAIVGSGSQGLKMLKYLQDEKDPWINVVGLYDDRVNRLAGHVDGVNINGDLHDLIEDARNRRIDDVLIALPWWAEERMMDVLYKLKVLPVRVRLCPEMVGFRFSGHAFSYYAGIATLNAFEKPLDGWSYVFKEAEDRVLGGLIFLLLLPVMLVIACAVKISSPGPVFFKQKRYGFNNEMIEVYKFRSMHADQSDNEAVKLVSEGDSRVTPLGRILRKTSLDELPQIINVIKGEMSLVGPRPHAEKAKAAGRYYYDVVEQYAGRHKVKPGITGWAQVNGWRGGTDTEEQIIKRVEHDIYYIEHWSIALDIIILFRTLGAVINSKNAY